MIKGIRNFSGVLMSVIILFGSCQKQETLIGRNLIPGSQYLNGIYTDTVTLKTKTIREDSLPTEFDPQFVLGSMADRVFGHSYAGIYTQVSLGPALNSFSDTASIDSIVLSLNLTGYYGDTNSVHNIRVFRLIDSMSALTTYEYESRKIFRYQPSPVGEKLGFKINKRILASSYFGDVDGLNLGSSLRIRLSPSLGQDILNQSSNYAFADNQNFVNYLRGFYIDDDTTLGFSNSMMYINLQGGSSMLEVYYHGPYFIAHPGTTPEVPLRFSTNGGAVNTNYFNHNYQNKITRAALANANPKVVDTVVYVQSIAGLKTYIQMPYISNLGNVLINEAQIQVTMALSDIADSAIYTLPNTMAILVADSTNMEAEAPDQGFSEGLPTYGGTKSYVTDPTTGRIYVRYTFSIAAQLQLMISNKYINNGFYLVTSPSNEIADRIILGGGNRNGDPYQMRLNLVYTKIR